MEQTLRSLKFLAPDRVDKAIELLKTCDQDTILMARLQKIKITGNQSEFIEVLDKIEKNFIKKNNINLKVNNLPKFADLQESGRPVKVYTSHIRDTFAQWGKIEGTFLVTRDGTGYLRYTNNSDAENAHRQLNGMQIGDNIIQTHFHQST
jgi:hypothetical protein